MKEATLINQFRVNAQDDAGDTQNYKGWLPLDDESEVENDDPGTITIDETTIIINSLLRISRMKII